MQIHVDYVKARMPVSGAKWAEIVRATQEDETLQRVNRSVYLVK